MQRESVGQSILVATCLCVVCSVLVSTAAVTLKPLQKANKLRQMRIEVLKVAGLYEEGVDVDEQFKQVDKKVANLETGELLEPEDVDPNALDERAAGDPEWSVSLAKKEDLAGIKRREKYSPVYLISDASGKMEQLILPVRGKGLWSTMYGFLALQPDLRTVIGITFYEHGETPGLGGEIESAKFREQWIGKTVRDPNGTPRFDFVRGSVDPGDPEKDYKIDGIAGATITTRGVTDMVHFWLGPNGYKSMLEKLSVSTAASKSLRRADGLVMNSRDFSVSEEK